MAYSSKPNMDTVTLKSDSSTTLMNIFRQISKYNFREYRLLTSNDMLHPLTETFYP